jgi:CheY-like chemotaxis protein
MRTLGSLIKDQFQGWTILIVDDEPDSLEVASRWLKLAGASIITAEDGRSGLEAARAHRPNFIITDLSMPDMDGWEMLYELRRDPAFATLPVIALTAHTMDGVKERVEKVGFTAYIPKPLNPSKFVGQVIEIVKGNGTLGAPKGAD